MLIASASSFASTDTISEKKSLSRGSFLNTRSITLSAFVEAQRKKVLTLPLLRNTVLTGRNAERWEQKSFLIGRIKRGVFFDGTGVLIRYFAA